MPELTPREKLTQLEAQLDAKPTKPKTKKAQQARQELMAEVAELRGIVRDIEVAQGTRGKKTSLVLTDEDAAKLLEHAPEIWDED